MRSRRRTGWPVIALVTVLLTGACARPERSGLHVKGYAADLVFSTNPRPPLRPLGGATSTATIEGGFVELPPAVFGKQPIAGSPSIRPRTCPDARPGSGALEAAPPVVPTGSRPEVGKVLWKRSGVQEIAGAGSAKLSINLGGFEQRVVRDVREVSDNVFAYQTVKPDIDGRTTYVTTWQVKSGAVQERISQLSAAVTVGDPERGLTIKAIDNFDANNNMTGSFRPTTGLLVLPLPVVPGEQFSSVAVDPQNFQVAQYQAEVVARERIDACGDYVEGWRVKGTMTFSSGVTQQYDFLVAPQFGALVVSERIAGTGVLGPYDVTFSLAQLHPTPTS